LKDLTEFIELAQKENLKVLKGGRFYHLQGDTDKAQPLHWLLENYSDVFGFIEGASSSKPTLICLGDNHNDVAMLNVADIPVCVKGWNEAVLSILDK